MNSEVKSEVKV